MHNVRYQHDSVHTISNIVLALKLSPPSNFVDRESDDVKERSYDTLRSALHLFHASNALLRPHTLVAQDLVHQ